MRAPADLAGLDGLVLPGGESTAMLKLMDAHRLEAAIRALPRRRRRALRHLRRADPARPRGDRPDQRSLGLLDVEVERNAYGRQIDSFETDLAWTEDGGAIRGVFIRAPRIRRVGPGVRVLAELDGEPVLVRNGRVLAATFHPELTDDTRVHRYFVEEMAGAPPIPGK